MPDLCFLYQTSAFYVRPLVLFIRPLVLYIRPLVLYIRPLLLISDLCFCQASGSLCQTFVFVRPLLVPLESVLNGT